MSTTPIPATPPTQTDVQTVVDLINKAKSVWGLFSALTSKKACVSITAAGLLYTAGYKALSVDIFASLWFFGLCTALIGVWVCAQAFVDAAQMEAIGHASTVTRSDIEALEKD